MLLYAYNFEYVDYDWYGCVRNTYSGAIGTTHYYNYYTAVGDTDGTMDAVVSDTQQHHDR